MELGKKEGGGVFEGRVGVDTPMHTMNLLKNWFWLLVCGKGNKRG